MSEDSGESAGLFYKIEKMMHENPGMPWDDAARKVTTEDRERQAEQWNLKAVGTEGGASSANEQQKKDRETLQDPTKPKFGGGRSSALSARLGRK